MILTEGARVRLRMMRREDADELYALLSDEAVMRWLEPPFNRAQAERFLEQAGLSEPPLIGEYGGRISRLRHLPRL